MVAALEKVLTQREVMEQLNLSRTTLWRWRRDGKLHSYQLGPRKVGYSMAHIQALLQNCEKGVSSGEA